MYKIRRNVEYARAGSQFSGERKSSKKNNLIDSIAEPSG